MAASPRAAPPAAAAQPPGSAQIPPSPAGFLSKPSVTQAPPRSLADAISERKKHFANGFPTAITIPGIETTFQKPKTPLQSIPPSRDFSRANTPSTATTPLTSATPTTVSGHNALPTSISSATASKLSIFGTLDAFERTVADLINTVGRYAPGAGAAKALIDADFQLGRAVDEFLLYQNNKTLIAKLTAVSFELDAQLNALLKTLSDARVALLSIPGTNDLGSKDTVDAPKTSYTELLAYATKIAKFSRAPPGFAPPPAWASPPPTEQPKTEASPDSHAPTVAEAVAKTLKDAYKDSSSIPANLPWPAEDEMRRGMLVQYNRLFGSDGGENGVVATEMAVVVPGQEGHPDNRPLSSSSQTQTNSSQPQFGSKRKRRENRRHKERQSEFASDIDRDDDNREVDDGEDEDDEDDDDEIDGRNNGDGMLSNSSDYTDSQEAFRQPNPSSGVRSNGLSAPASNGHSRQDNAVNREALLDLDLFDPNED
ncbi:vitamin-D-receptor interacting mediator subunit 4-domain-containing protein [Lipomyces orientalis]|uniref:Vitamin-D-receptor interacting mediator subunit 4-domain-containing protein n=1 Tax=Lipomyces orientalis TaxID=1233043 RepID=A0ACC3TR48_9ASCO